MTDVEVIEFKPPTGAGTLLYLTDIQGWNQSSDELQAFLRQHFSKYGLLNQINVNKSEEDNTFYSYVRAESGSRLRLGGVSMRVGRGSASSCLRAPNLPLAVGKCEELANYYLGFNGWNSNILYHRMEDSAPGHLTYVTVVKLSFPINKEKSEFLSCEGAGKVSVELPSNPGEKITTVKETAKRCKGEAVQAAWSKVVLAIVNGSKVMVQINTTKVDAFHYEPLWDEPVVTVKEAHYKELEDFDDILAEEFSKEM